MYRYICQECGAFLDPGEHCDCQERKEKQDKQYREILSQEQDGQVVFGGEFYGLRAG